MKFVKIFCSLILLFSAGLQTAFACSCVGSRLPPCYAYGSYEAIFVGTIRDVELIDGKPRGKVTVDVEKNYKGMPAKTAYTVDLDNSCALGYQKGEKFLFYTDLVNPETPTFKTYSCGSTTRIQNAPGHLAYLDSLDLLNPRYTLFGTLFDRKAGPLSGLKAVIDDNGKKTTVISDEDGRILLNMPKAGKYTVRLFIPKDKVEAAKKSWAMKWIKNSDFTSAEPFMDFEVEIEPNACGWFNLELSDYL